MCFGFGEAFMAAMAAGSASAGTLAAAIPATAEASLAAGAGLAEAGTMATVGAGLGAGASALTSTGGLLALGSGAMSAVSSGMQASAQQKALQYQSAIDQQNVTLAQQQSAAALQAGNQQVMQSEMQANQVLGSQKANLAANGVDLGSGSAIDLMATTKFLNQADVANIETNSARQAWGYGVDAANSQASSNLASWQAANTNPALIGGMSGASSLLGSASLYAMGNKTNLFNSMV